MSGFDRHEFLIETGLCKDYLANKVMAVTPQQIEILLDKINELESSIDKIEAEAVVVDEKATKLREAELHELCDNFKTQMDGLIKEMKEEI